MFLKQLEFQGFKTFAKKTSLVFPAPKKKDCFPLTCIVGPNGSGKSNIADAVRWVLGEQSLKLLRGKKSEDVIFSGSEKRSRSGFAEVSMVFENEDRAIPLDGSEVCFLRRMYRDGASEYIVNNQQARLLDIQQLLAAANVGQRSYSVIGQGMVDHILLSTPQERKAFFDDATGVKSLQLKRQETARKLEHTKENLTEIELLLAEIEPRLRSLKRQVSRLEQRETLEQELFDLEKRYYHTVWKTLEDDLQTVDNQLKKQEEGVIKGRDNLRQIDETLNRFEQEQKTVSVDQELLDLRKARQNIENHLRKLREDIFHIQKEIELSKIRAQENWSPLPLHQIIETLAALLKEEEQLEIYWRQYLEKKQPSPFSLEKIISLKEKTQLLLERLERPRLEDIIIRPELLDNLQMLEKIEQEKKKELAEFEQALEKKAKETNHIQEDFFVLQKQARKVQQDLHGLEEILHKQKIEQARLQERQQNLWREIQENMKDRASQIHDESIFIDLVDLERTHEMIQRLHSKLELIGGFDPEILVEYNETNERFQFLESQLEDLKKAFETTQKLIRELDEEIHARSEKAFQKINESFQHYFQILFSGGKSRLVKMTQAELEEDQEDLDKTGYLQSGDEVLGIEIEATPPGKRLKSLALLSGGEKALTSLALLSAILTVNPCPFVILDEVDASLDEANTLRFANILQELQKLSQFIVITHNRATMEKADILYGVTMDNDGVSRLFSVKLEEMNIQSS
ncbi:hypothetical protein CO172_02415 [Candidatus Uhrbacteria bacterium CG_4_9_14_3_um_filter_36_7]|uniref:RecF/RecN/SMC N-terminal domain-containing protein n=1 Tax=Candidatus Uhrbacteria bacterium CG_4_9_14_3_um_filter_36_7 TaxID=1975033 RepID=A0A2M7XHD0_9BACT|nr:MAG: hypothetical protein CO172_02415 [Candidatus Uhrbacteria bacterium CG_4_9_14_3_um_filter_36_7]